MVILLQPSPTLFLRQYDTYRAADMGGEPGQLSRAQWWKLAPARSQAQHLCLATWPQLQQPSLHCCGPLYVPTH
ncbi:hypothetical protein FKM82_026642 [Ascaphus truei]